MEKDLSNYLLCLICFDPAEVAFQTGCCGKILCEKCLLKIKQEGFTCPNCRNHQFPVSANKVVRKMVAALPVTCESCGIESNRGNIKSHRQHCDKRVRKCYLCSISDSRQGLLSHFIQTHGDQVLAVFQQASSAATEINRKIAQKRNKQGRLARPGSTGKFYCKGKLSCLCCNGECGPTNGCNCESCMQLDLISRGINPYATSKEFYLVNKMGLLSCYNPTTKRFQCGAKVVPHGKSLRYCEQSCPKPCAPCQVLLRDIVRYKKLDNRVL